MQSTLRKLHRLARNHWELPILLVIPMYFFSQDPYYMGIYFAN